jgi:hypothetical protein
MEKIHTAEHLNRYIFHGRLEMNKSTEVIGNERNRVGARKMMNKEVVMYLEQGSGGRAGRRD